MKDVYEKFAAAHGFAVKVREVGINTTFTKLAPNEVKPPAMALNGR
jgi:hypothetical protein